MGRDAGPWKREGRDWWYAWIDGKQRRLIRGDAPRKDAVAELHRRRAKSAEKLPDTPGSPSVEWLCDKLLEHVRGNNEPLTVEFYERHLVSFCEVAGNLAASQIRPHHVTDWAIRPAWSATTRAGAIGVVKRVFRWAKKQGYLESNPIADVERPTAAIREAILSEAQYRVILAAAKDSAWRTLLESLWETGCRPGELIGVAASAIDLTSGTMEVLNKTRRHTTRTRTVHLTPRMLEILAPLVRRRPTGPVLLNARGRPWTRNAMACRFARIRAKFGWGDEATAYSLRHLYVTDALEREVPIATVAELVGHSDTRMISRVYSKLRSRSGHLRAAAGRVRPSEPEPRQCSGGAEGPSESASLAETSRPIGTTPDKRRRRPA